MTFHSQSRRAGVVCLASTLQRTITGALFPSGRKQRVDVPLLSEQDVDVLQTVTEPLRYFFLGMEWEEWGIEIVEGAPYIAEVLPEEQTLRLERRAIDHIPLASWECFGAFLRAILGSEYDHYVDDAEIAALVLYAQLSWFARESLSWQQTILTFLVEESCSSRELFQLLLKQLPIERSAALLRDLDIPEDKASWKDTRLEAKAATPEARWNMGAEYLLTAHDVTLPELPIFFDEKRFAQFKRAFSICSLLPWQALCSGLPGMLTQFFKDIPPTANSTDRRLGLFRIVAEHGLHVPGMELNAFAWPRISVLVLDPQRHPKIYQALQQFLELTLERELGVLWPISDDETMLARLAMQNQLSEQDDRFFRQATHVQAIWRDILHRSASQEWASELLFDHLERVVSYIEAEPDLLFAAVIWNRAMWEASPTPIAPALQNLRELLWVLSQAPLAVLRRLYPEHEGEVTNAHEKWPLLRSHLKRFLHLAPPILSRLCEQLDDEQGRPTTPEPQPHEYDVDADPDIPQQELHGRILPLLSRPDIKRYHHIDLEQTETLRILHLDRYLHQSSGLWKEHRFFSSFLLFFKTRANKETGGWSELALWIDKDLDLNKVVNKKGISSTIRGLLLEDGIWERTYRYQFLTVKQLMAKLNPGASEWEQLLELLGSEYRDLIERRLREVLDYQYYLVRGAHLPHRALIAPLDEEHLHAFWRLPVEEFESCKHTLSEQMATAILDEFYRVQLQDDRSWEHAHMAMTRTLKDVSSLLELSPGELVEAKENSTDLHKMCAGVLGNWLEQQDDMAGSGLLAPLKWINEKSALLQRLHQEHIEGAVQFVRFLLEQFEEPIRVVELLMEQPLEEDSDSLPFKPIPTSDESAERQKELIPFLRHQQGQLINPGFLRLLCCVPPELIRATLDVSPTLLPALQQAAYLLRDMQHDPEETTAFWELLEDIQTAQATVVEGHATEEQFTPPPTEEQIQPNPEPQQESPSSDCSQEG